ncbi:cell wall-active antibiotics response protein LiaF [uncultured Vagococcus sp.]|uniref:cell wall-active antibiotics response protein LiaF n=1 Tax=uncultured Vagococcus sp. TaxID=189676 RepID=UPI0028D60264|nr:cell wall-active antibiotics response protein LiaF [uncultured Vagococcus sp.]
MRSSWKFFIVVEALLLILTAYQLIQNPGAIAIVLFALVNLVYALKREVKTSFNQFQMIVSVAVIILCLLISSPLIWIMMVFAVIFIGLKGVEVSGVALFDSAPWRKKHMVMVETAESDPKNGRRFKRPWIGNQRIGSSVYEWDDINFTIISGDTIIDLGNTLLPKTDNVIMIRKGFGRTRVLVPVGIGIVLEHSTLLGNVIFEDEFFRVKNESLKIYSDDYDGNSRRLKIVTSTFMGDVEVIRI